MSKNHVKTVSCAECRRLKLKCDRIFPCSSCRKRGCDALCPNGSLPTRPRAVFQETERLKNRISLLTDRIHGLEAALEKLHAQVSPDDRHPLLVDELLEITRESDGTGQEKEGRKDIKVGEDDRSSQEQENLPDCGEGEDINNLKEGLGTLALHSDGRSRFYGPTAAIESLFQSEFHDSEPDQVPERHQPPPSISSFSLDENAFWPNESDDYMTDGDQDPDCLPRAIHEPICQPHWFASPLPPNQVVKVVVRLESHLPDHAKAWSLCEAYFEHAAWLHSCIHRKDFISDVFSRIYDSGNPKGSLISPPTTIPLPFGSNEPVSMENVAILFTTFAIGSLLDLTVPAHHPPMVAQAEQYYDLACTALGVAGTAERGSVSCVQCLILMAYYHLLLDNPDSSQRSWALIGLTVNVAQSIGLHRDSAWWNTNSGDIQRRRDVFWELFTFERLQSLTMGLPPSLSLEHVDCEFPEDTDQVTSSTEGVEHSFIWKKKKWAKDVVSDVIDVLMTTPKRPVSYATILALDRRLRDDLSLKSKDVFGDPRTGLIDARLAEHRICFAMQRIVNVLTQETLLLLIHRVYLARALNGPPTNVFGSKYGPSVLASYRSACHIVILHRSLASLDSVLPSRLWFIWNHLLGAAIVLAALAIKNPWCTIAPGVLSQLDATHELLERAASQGATRPAKALTIVGRLRKDAHLVYDNAQKSSSKQEPHPNAGYTVGTVSGVEHQSNEELNITFDGHAVRQIPNRQPSQSATSIPSPTSPSLDTSNPQPAGQLRRRPATTSTASSSSNIFDTLHPDLMEDLQATNKLNETKYPWLDWSFKGLASWNDGQAENTVPDVTYLPQGTAYGTDPTAGVQNSFEFAVSSSLMEGNGMVRDNLGPVAGGVTWDPSWQSLMDQLGVAQFHPT